MRVAEMFLHDLRDPLQALHRGRCVLLRIRHERRGGGVVVRVAAVAPAPCILNEPEHLHVEPIVLIQALR